MSTFRVITGCGLAIALCGLPAGCGDDDDDNGDGNGQEDAAAPDAAAPDAAAPDAAAPPDAGGDTDAGDMMFELTGEVGPVENTAEAAQCTATSDTRNEGGCYAHLCGTNSNSVAAAITEASPCGTDAQIWLICDGLPTREASRCARANALEEDTREATRMCLREVAELDPLTDACVDCYLDSVECAREFCLSACLAGDSPQCDTCRIENGCTPGFYACAGIPNPL